MTRIEATGVVDANGNMTLPVPPNVSPGNHQVVVVVDLVDDSPRDVLVEQSLDQRGTRLVFTGEIEADPETVRLTQLDTRQRRFVDDGMS